MSSRQVDALLLTTGQPDLALGEMVQLVEAIARHLVPTSPLQHLKELELAATKGWLLSSSEVEGLIRYKPFASEGRTTVYSWLVLFYQVWKGWEPVCLEGGKGKLSDHVK